MKTLISKEEYDFCVRFVDFVFGKNDRGKLIVTPALSDAIDRALHTVSPVEECIVREFCKENFNIDCIYFSATPKGVIYAFLCSLPVNGSMYSLKLS